MKRLREPEKRPSKSLPGSKASGRGKRSSRKVSSGSSLRSSSKKSKSRQKASKKPSKASKKPSKVAKQSAQKRKSKKKSVTTASAKGVSKRERKPTRLPGRGRLSKQHTTAKPRSLYRKGRRKSRKTSSDTIKVALGVRTNDPFSKSPVLRRDRGIYTYYHHADRLGLAQQHILGIADRTYKATRTLPHELIFRLHVGEGGQRETLTEVAEAHKRGFVAAGYGAKMRTHENADGSIDAEIRIDISMNPSNRKDVFREAVLTLGDIAHIPKSI
jgi:hypothetical protein